MSLRPRLVNFDETWDKILSTIKAVVTLDKIPRAVWNDRFSDVYALCVAYPEPLGERLFTAVKEFLENHVEKLYETVSHSDDVLQVYHQHWSQYSKGSLYSNLLFGYLNQHMKKHRQDLSDLSPYANPFFSDSVDEISEIGPLALDIWKKNMITPLKETLVQHLLAEIKRDRDGEMTHQHILHDTILSFVGVQEYQTRGSLQLYEEVFEKPLLKETREYYSREAAEIHADCTCSVYIQKVDQCIQDEDLRTRKFLHPVSYSRVIRECESRLVEQYIPFLQTECRQMVKEEKCEDLTRMYKLLHHLPSGIQAMLSEVEQHIVEIGMDAIKSLQTDNGPSQFVEALLNVHRKFTQLIESTFKGDRAFHSALDRACITIVNYRHDPKKLSKSPELLARYTDSLLKKSTKNLTERELDEKLNEIIITFKYIDDKDIFQKFYSKMLAKRLIHGLSVSMDAEEAMISRLKHACGYEYTNRLHRMFTDMSISSDLNNSFTDFLSSSKTNLGINFSLLVLTSGAWPLNQTSISPLTIPQLLVNCVLKFEQFYGGRYSGRKLTWLQHLSTGDLKVSFLKRPYIITVTTYQMAVLLLFNDRTSFAYGDILVLTDMVERDLTRTLQSLVDVKLLEKTKDEEFTNCTFSLNMGFSNKRTKLKITAAMQKDTPQESEQTMQSVDDDRNLYLQATVVRIMKSRKTLKHNSLIEEVISQSRARFTPSIPMIKKCVESLIEKQYLERREGSKDEYNYVA